MKCASCDGVAHPATGCVWSPQVIVCRSCADRFWEWFQHHTDARPRKKKGKPSPDFYGAALNKHEGTTDETV